jgi:chemotaxis protein methyltransferase CheR
MNCTGFLQWALPQRDLHWPGFRKVHHQVCKRLNRRMRELGLSDFAGYRAQLEADPSEWRFFDDCCHITISRFFRDKGVFEVLRTQVLPAIAARSEREGRLARIWSAGCASGEEPYTMKILWDLQISRSYPGASLRIVATDVDESMLKRALEGCFEASSLHELPSDIIDVAFDRSGPRFCAKARHREGIEFLSQDLRMQTPASAFDLILCRYVAFTYFAPPLQRQTLASVVEHLAPDGYLAIGDREHLPRDGVGLTPLPDAPCIFRKQLPSLPASRKAEEHEVRTGDLLQGSRTGAASAVTP